MKNLKKWLLLLLLATWTAGISELNAEKETLEKLVFQEKFEKEITQLKKDGWILPENCTVSHAQDDKFSLEVISTHKKNYAEFFLPVKWGKIYSVEGWVKCENVTGTRGATIFCQFANSNREWIRGGSFPSGLYGNSNWKLLKSKTKPIPEDVKYIKLMTGINGTGKAWFASIKVEELEYSGPEIITPSENALIDDTALPVFKWEEKLQDTRKVNFPNRYYNVEISQKQNFLPEQTINTFTMCPSIKSPTPLKSGKWYWRIQELTTETKYPFGETHSFDITENASKIIWPPIITPLWGWQSSLKPILRAYVGPEKVAAAGNISVSIDDVAANIISYKNNILEFQSPNTISPGLHNINIKVKRDNERFYSQEYFFCNKQIKDKFEIRKDNILLINDKPFFPLGAYRDTSDTLDDFSGIREAGFNLTHDSYKFENNHLDIGKMKEYLNNAEKNGVKVFMGLEYKLFQKHEYKYLQKIVSELMEHPALLTWYLPEEPVCRNILTEHLLELKDSIKSIDSEHPISLLLINAVFNNKAILSEYAKLCDIIWTDPYPIPDFSLKQVEDWTRESQQLSKSPKPVWTVLQAFDYQTWRAYLKKEKVSPKKPTPEETRFMAYLALCADAKGLIWYWSPNSAYNIRKDTPEIWKGICDTVQELKSLMPFLIAEKTDNDTIQAPEPFRTWTRKTENKRILILLNTSEKETGKIKLDLNKYSFKKIMRYSDKSEIQIKDKILVEELKPIEVKIYLLAD